MTYAEVRQKALQLLDQYSNGGSLISIADSNTQDYVLKFPQLCDSAQKEIATTAQPIRARTQLSLGMIPNLLKLPAGAAGMVQHLDTDLTDAVATGARSYYFEADGLGTTYIEEQTAPGVWSVLDTVNTMGGGYAAYMGLVSPSSAANSVRMRHGGSYPYRVRNRAMYGYTFASADDVPAFGLMEELTLPTDFWRMNRLLRDGVPVDYESRGRNVIAVDATLAGELDVHYFKMPATIPNGVADGYVFEVSEEAAQAIPHYVTSKCMATSPQYAQASANELSEYQAKLANLRDEPKQSRATVRNVFGAASRSQFRS